MAKDRMSEGGEGTQNFASPNSGEWREDGGEQIGISKETVRKATDVYRFAYPDEYVHARGRRLNRSVYFWVAVATNPVIFLTRRMLPRPLDLLAAVVTKWHRNQSEKSGNEGGEKLHQSDMASRR